ncbi:MAG: TIGR03619 family F420-dependent LLM class oxidoreductase [Chromatiales bacterium]|jgi:probable F420-dependent oxidoreductase|nr:TIGR03619 family F420-dependent LLM class oxidoreductase [Chromatiales bacterium]
MKIGTTIRNMGPAATTERIRYCAEHAEDVGLDHVWVVDHVAIPPDDAEGSEGRWFDPLATLAFLAAATKRIELGVAVLVAPYRPPIPTAKWIATIQELSGGRLHLGVGVGWMQAEFDALGVDRRQRGRMTDELMDFIRDCFAAADDIMQANGQAFYFRPRPACPKIYVGGMSGAAMQRAIDKADGWIPMGIDPAKLASRVARLKDMAAAANRPCPQIIGMGALPASQEEAVQWLGALEALGATDYIQSSRYLTEHEFDAVTERLTDLKRQLP